MATKKPTKKTTTKAPSKKDFKTQTLEQLQSELISMQTDLVDAKRSHAARELVSTVRIKDLRRTVARIKTAISLKKKEENV